MLTTKDFLKQYEHATDKELYAMFLNQESYSEEGQMAISLVIESRGGIINLENLMQENLKVDKERSRIKHEASKLATQDADPAFISKLLSLIF